MTAVLATHQSLHLVEHGHTDAAYVGSDVWLVAAHYKLISR